jgi:CheY-like chemotaxis protein
MVKETEAKKILLVDDDEIHLILAEAMLKDEYAIITAKSGKEALAYFLQGQFPNLVLLDILMPNMDGWETFNRLKAISFLKDIPIAFLTSINETAEKNHALEIGAADFITKPYEREELLERVGKILTKHQEKIATKSPLFKLL